MVKWLKLKTAFHRPRSNYQAYAPWVLQALRNIETLFKYREAKKVNMQTLINAGNIRQINNTRKASMAICEK